MSQLLIEDIAIALNKAPEQLNDLELRNLCILIDWSLALTTHQKDISFTPLLKEIKLSQDEYSRLASIIVEAVKSNTFPELHQLKPDSSTMDNLFERLGKLLGVSSEVIQNIDTGFISDYESKIKEKGLVYTNFLTYKKSLSHVETATINDIQLVMKKKHRWLDELPILYFDQKNNVMRVDNIVAMNANIEPNAHFYYLLDLLYSLSNFTNLYGRVIDHNDLQRICFQLQLLAPHIIPDIYIDQTLQDLIHKIKDKPAVLTLKKMLSELIILHSEMRAWKTFTHFKVQEPIHRIILMSYEDVADEEIIRTVNMMYRNHPLENIAVSYSADDARLVLTPFTLQVIGHGTIQSENNFNANLGPFRGNAVTTGQQLAELVNGCPMITHVRLSCCFAGKLGNTPNLATLYEKFRELTATSKEYRRKFLLTTHNDLNPTNSPFANHTAAINCWNAINKHNRELSMTVSPGIIEPDEAIGHLIWKAAPSDLEAEQGVKEITISTSQGPKCLHLWQIKQRALKNATNTGESISLTKRISQLFLT
jgi:hypothetical protein